MTIEEAAETFCRMVLEHGFNAALNDTMDGLHGTNGRGRWGNIQEWFANLDAKQQSHINFVLKEAVTASLFHVLVCLDGDSLFGTDEQPVVFSMSVRRFKDFDHLFDGEFIDSKEISPWLENGDRLHDIFMNLIDEQNGDVPPASG